MSGDGKPLFIAMLHTTADLLLQSGRETALRLWVALARGADWVSGETWPSYETLRERHHLSTDAIAKGIRQLEELGLLERKRRFSASTRYFIKGFAQFEAIPLQRRVHSSAKQRKVLGIAEAIPLQRRVHSSVPPETNDHHPNDRPLNERKGDDPAAGAAGPPPPALQETFADLFHLAKARGVQGTDDQIADHVRGWLLQKGEGPVKEILNRLDVVGVDVFAIQKQYFNGNGKKSAPVGGPKRPAKPDCPKCGGSGRRDNPVTGGTYSCLCTELAHTGR